MVADERDGRQLHADQQPALLHRRRQRLRHSCKLWAKTASAYTTPAIPSTSDDPPRLSGVDMVDAFSYTSASPLDMDALNAGPFTSTGYKGDYLVLVFEVETTASQGVKTAETLTLAWDEV
jgi:hypothetical protein